MGFNYGYEKKKFDSRWKRLEVEYCDAGMSEEQIAAMKEYDWAWFCSQRVFQNHKVLVAYGFAVKGFFKTIRNQYLVNNMMKYVVNHSCSESLHRYLINGMLIRLIKRDMDGWLRWKTNNYC